MRLPRTYGLVRSTIMINRFVVLFLFFTGSLFSEEIRKLPNDIRWVGHSLEYENLCRQIYQQAWQEIKKQSSKAKGKLAIVVDLDETVLNNNSYQVDRWKKGLGFTQESWSEWVNQKRAVLIPGAKTFLDRTRTLGVTIIFLSNRMQYNLRPTIENMKSLKVWNEDDLFLLRENKLDNKKKRRAEVRNGMARMEQHGPFHVLAYLGDQIGDFPTDEKGAFGVTQFLFPNPTYGKW